MKDRTALAAITGAEVRGDLQPGGAIVEYTGGIAFLATDLTQKVLQVDIPVYFFHGKYNYTVSYPLAKAYFDEL